MGNTLLDLLTDADHLSSSIYDVAVVALFDGSQREECVRWLIDHRNADGSWGETLSWQDRYLCTYSAAVAMIASGNTTLGYESLDELEEIPDCYPDNWTANFGGLVAAVDAFAFWRLGLTVDHHEKVQTAITYDSKKWRTIVGHDAFYDPLKSIAGFFAEWAYILPTLDIERLINNFQVENGSISNSPSASAFCLIACKDRQLESERVTRLRDYVESLNPFNKEVGILDQVPHFVTSWLLLYIDHSYGEPIPNTESITALRATLAEQGKLVSVAGDSTFPGDMDTTACAIIGLNLPTAERARIMSAFEDMFHEDHYITFRYERTPSVTTNVHAVAAWPENPHAPVILDWIAKEMTRQEDLPHCKWHSSPFYTLGEIGRLFADIPHPQAQSLARRAGYSLLDHQLANGSWGWQGSTVQETSCAVLALDKLRKANIIRADLIDRPIRQAGAYLSTGATDYRSLWIGKSLYYLKPLERWLRQLALAAANREYFPATETKPISVLYVDDNPSWRRVFEATMAYYEWDFTIMEDAASALRYLEHKVPDIVVIDLVMPGMSGYQAFEKIRQMKLDCSVVATTAHYSTETADEIRKMGFDGYLEKPFSVSTVVDYLRKIAS